ncbi:MAG: S9 family peptidase, partial [Zavarzinella sp.]|nr:S9 family peptidase [Zavarzinella sp.]
MRRSPLWCLLVCLLAPVAARADKRPMKFEDLAAFQRVADPQISPDGRQMAYQVTTVDLPGNKTTTNIWVAAVDGKSPPRRLTTSTKADRHPRWSADGSRILFESTRSGDSQLWVIDLGGGEARQLTTISTGASNGIWAPDGKTVAFVSAVYPEYSEKPFAESDKLNKERLEKAEKGPVKARIFTRLFFRHWDEYVEDKRQHLFVVNADGGEPHDATPGDRDAYPTSTTFSVGDDFTFSPDGTHLVFTAVPEKNEAWSTNHDLCRVSVTNTSPKWETLTKDNPAADGSPRFSRDGKKLAWRAQKRAGYEADKWDILVADCKPDGSPSGHPTNLTASRDVSVNEFAWGAGDKLCFVADDGGATSLFHTTSAGQVGDGISYRSRTGGVAARQGQISSLTASHAGDVWVHSFARMTQPPEVVGVRFTGPDEHGLTETLGGVSPQNRVLLDQLDRPRPESVEVPVEGGVKMQMWVLRPPGFDEKKKWPVAYLVHGGPQGAWEDGWSNRWNPSLWAAQGYVVVLPNPRGSTGFGQKFVDQISGDWGGKCYRDLVKGLDYVESLP